MCSCSQVAHWIVLGIYPSVVIVAFDTIGHGGSIAQHGILPEVVTDDATVGAAQCAICCTYRQCAVFYLLQDVVLTVSLVNLREMLLLIDGRHIYFRLKLLVYHRQIVGFANLRLDAKVQVASIVPSAHSQSIHLFFLSKRRQSRFLIITIYTVFVACHACIVHVTSVVPNAIFLVDPHVTHLIRQEIFYHRLPYTTVKHGIVDSKYRRLHIAIAYLVESRSDNVREIETCILVAQKISPLVEWHGAYHFLAFRANVYEFGSALCTVSAVHFHYRHLLLVSEISHL